MKASKVILNFMIYNENELAYPPEAYLYPGDLLQAL